MTVHSYSALKCFSTCPRQYEALYLTKSVKRTSSPALEKGIAWHEALEKAVRDNTPLPSHLSKWQPLANTLRKAGAQVEVKLAMDREGNPCGFWDKHAWLRGAIDVDTGQLLLDWKTGKVYPDPLQADVYTALKRASLPKLKVDFHFVYLEHSKVVTMKPNQDATNRVVQYIARVEQAETYPPRPCFACRWCPVTQCEYNGG